MVILTKHCTVRLDRIPKLDELETLGPIYLNNTHNDAIDNKTVSWLTLLMNQFFEFNASKMNRKQNLVERLIDRALFSILLNRF